MDAECDAEDVTAAAAHPICGLRRSELLRLGAPVSLHVLLQDDRRQLQPGRNETVTFHCASQYTAKESPTSEAPPLAPVFERSSPGGLRALPEVPPSALPGGRQTLPHRAQQRIIISDTVDNCSYDGAARVAATCSDTLFLQSGFSIILLIPQAIIFALFHLMYIIFYPYALL